MDMKDHSLNEHYWRWRWRFLNPDPKNS